MSKRVHFAQTTRVYAEEGCSPSPSFSDSSLPSSSPGPTTPPLPPHIDDDDSPTVVYPVTPFVSQLQLESFPSDIPKPMHIHFMLAFSPYNEPAIPWDVSCPPPTPSYKPDDQQILLREMLTEPATSPPLTSLSITHPLLKWRIIVEPKDPAPGAYISVHDVLTTLFKELRIGIQSSDYAELTEADARSAVDAAYYARCGKIPDSQSRLLERQKGIKRVDMLMGRTKFLGLSATFSEPECWELNTAF